MMTTNPNLPTRLLNCLVPEPADRDAIYDAMLAARAVLIDFGLDTKAINVVFGPVANGKPVEQRYGVVFTHRVEIWRELTHHNVDGMGDRDRLRRRPVLFTINAGPLPGMLTELDEENCLVEWQARLEDWLKAEGSAAGSPAKARQVALLVKHYPQERMTELREALVQMGFLEALEAPPPRAA